MASSCTRAGLDWMLGKMFPPEVWVRPWQFRHQDPWRDSKDMCMWHSGTWASDGLGSAGLMLDLMILEVFPTSVITAHSGNPMIPYGTELILLCPGHVTV